MIVIIIHVHLSCILDHGKDLKQQILINLEANSLPHMLPKSTVFLLNLGFPEKYKFVLFQNNKVIIIYQADAITNIQTDEDRTLITSPGNGDQTPEKDKSDYGRGGQQQTKKKLKSFIIFSDKL